MEHGEPLRELTEEQRAALRKELSKDVFTLAKRAARAVGDAAYEHVHSPEGAHTKALLETADQETGGLLSRLATFFAERPKSK